MSVFTKQGPNLDAADDSEYSHDHRSHQKLRTKSPNKILTQHACKESLIYIINSGKQPKKTELCNCCVFFSIHFPYLHSKTTRRREACIFLVLPRGISNTYDRRTDIVGSHKKAVYRANMTQFLFLELQHDYYKTCIA